MREVVAAGMMTMGVREPVERVVIVLRDGSDSEDNKYNAFVCQTREQ